MDLCTEQPDEGRHQNCFPRQGRNSFHQNSKLEALKVHLIYKIKALLDSTLSPTFRCLGYEVDGLCFAPQTLPGAIYPDIRALDPVLGLGQRQVVLQHAALLALFLAAHGNDVMSRCPPLGVQA